MKRHFNETAWDGFLKEEGKVPPTDVEDVEVNRIARLQEQNGVHPKFCRKAKKTTFQRVSSRCCFLNAGSLAEH